MKNLIKALEQASADHVAALMKRYDADPTGNDGRLISGRPAGKPYAGTPAQQRAKVLKKIEAEASRRLARELDKIAGVLEFSNNNGGPALPRPVVVQIHWTRNRTWGATAKASDNYGHTGEVASGCGYDKQSTALASVLNMHPLIMRRLYAAADKLAGKQENYRKEIGYGAGYSVLPYFEGGVGVSSHVQILERLGYKVTWSGDVVVISES